MNLDVSTIDPAATPPVPQARYEIHHYPAALIDMRTLPDGRRLMLRPVLPQDEPLLAGLVGRLSSAGRRNRFHGAVNIGPAQLQRMSRVDYARELAFVITACKGGTECVVADARYCVDADAQGAEFALMVDERWQRLGLGCWAMQALRDAAQSSGLTWLHGEVLSDNAPMRALMQRCGLCCTADPEDDRLVQVQLRLGHAPSLRPSPAARARRSVLAWLTGRSPGQDWPAEPSPPGIERALGRAGRVS
jgi:acetyltransferase